MDVEGLPPTLSVEEAAELLGLSRSAAYRAAARGELPTLRFGKRLIVPTRRLREMLGYETEDPKPGERVRPSRPDLRRIRQPVTHRRPR